MCNPARHAVPALVALGICALVVAVGCEPAYQAPAPPPPPRALTVYPEQRQSQAQQNKDQAQCQNTASAQANSSESWAQIFAACMSGRGYAVR